MPPRQTVAIVLAGGRSTRLGRDKAGEPLLGIPMLRRVLDRLADVVDGCIVVRRQGQTLPPEALSGVGVVEDDYPDAGPLGGIYTGLRASGSARALAVACDAPLLQPSLLRELLRLAPGHDAVVPLAEGLPQTLCAAYSQACLDPMRRRLEAGELRLASVLDDVATRYLTPEEWRRFDAEGLSFLNANNAAALERVRALLGAEAAAGRSDARRA